MLGYVDAGGMMWPVIGVVQTANGPMTIYTYGAVLVIALLAVPAYALTRAGVVGVYGSRLFAAWVSAVVGGYAGSLAGAAVGARWLGLLGAAAGVVLYVRRYPIAYRGLPDLVAPGVALSLALSKVACLLAGCCSGAIAPTPSRPLGVLPASFTGGQVWLSSTFPFVTLEFHNGVGMRDVPLYPTQLWAVALWLALAVWLSWRLARRRFDGEITASMLVIGAPLWWLTGWIGAPDVQGSGSRLLVVVAAVVAGSLVAVLGRRWPGVAAPIREGELLPDLD